MYAISQEKIDNIHNALIVGMALEDAYLYAGLTPKEILAVGQDEDLQRLFKVRSKQTEYKLLNQLQEIASKQTKQGREGAVTWMLEKFYPRYNGKPLNEGGEVHLHFADADPTKDKEHYDNVQVFIPKD